MLMVFIFSEIPQKRKRLPGGFKDAINTSGIESLAFTSFPFSMNDTIMCQYLTLEIKWKRTFEVDKNFFILELVLIMC